MTRHINNLIAGARAEGEISYQLEHNEAMAEEWDRVYHFENLELIKLLNSLACI